MSYELTFPFLVTLLKGIGYTLGLFFMLLGIAFFLYYARMAYDLVYGDKNDS